MRVIILDLQTMDAPIVPLADFLAANADDEETCASVRALRPGQGMVVGGGAAPAFAVSMLR